MSKRLAVTLLSVGIAALVGILIWAIAAGGSMWHGVLWGQAWATGPERSVATYDVDASNIDSVMASLVAEDVTVQPGGSGKIHVEQFARTDIPDEYLMRVREDGKRLIVESAAVGRVMMFGSFPYSRVEIMLPQRLADTLSIGTVSGEIAIDDVDANMVDASTTSGDVRVMGVETKRIECETTSGEVTLEPEACDTIDAGTTSGTIYVRANVQQGVDLSCISGDIYVEGSAESANLSTTSGEIRGEYRQLGQLTAGSTSGSIDVSIADAAHLASVECGTLSGDVRVAIPPGTAVSTDFSSVSGTMHTDTSGGGIEIRDAGIPISVDTTSGDFTLTTSI